MLVSGCTATQPEAGIDAGGVLTRPVDIRTLSRLRRAGPRMSVVSDNWAGLVAAARDLGYHGVALDRSASHPADGVIRSLDELLPPRPSLPG